MMYFKDLIAPAALMTMVLKQGCSVTWSGIVGALAAAAPIALPFATQAQNYPNKPITFYVSYGAGATTDITARALARAAEPILGVPITIDNKGGGGGTVAAGMLVSKKPDGYTVLVGATSAITVRPALMKVSYKASDIVGVMQYSYFHNGSVVIPADSPWKSIEDFIEAAKKNPGMSYATAGGGGVATTSQQMGVEALKRCKGLDFKHVPTKGGTEANTMLMGKHVNFTSGSGSHNPLVVDGVFRQLVLFQTMRDDNFPDVRTLKEIGCDWDNPPNSGMLVTVRAGTPPDIIKKLEDTFMTIAQSAEFRAMLKQNYLPFELKDSKTLNRDLALETTWYKDYFTKTGDLK
ncbi:MAG: tripartite tricarboxylate transporter substrate binding protein [Alcaligenaceae bacterium]